MIGVRTDSGLVTHWRIALGVGEPTRARYAIGLSVIVILERSAFAHQVEIVYSYICTWLDAYMRGISGRNSF